MCEIRYLGCVQWFDDAKGYGFIDCQKVDAPVFVHHQDIQTDGYTTLRKGQTVEFSLETGKKGPLARKVKPV